MMKEDITVLGAGPYGLAIAAHLRTIAGLDFRIFGDPMWFWKNQMPAGMLLRSDWGASQLWDPAHRYSLEAYQSETGDRFSSPVPLAGFVNYGLWFQRNVVPNLDTRKIAEVASEGRRFPHQLRGWRNLENAQGNHRRRYLSLCAPPFRI